MVAKKEKYIELREGAKVLYQLIQDTMPESPERVQALINVEQALMWANTALSRYKEAGGRREELFLSHIRKGFDYRDFTLNPLAKAEPKKTLRTHCACGARLVGYTAECPNKDCDQK